MPQHRAPSLCQCLAPKGGTFLYNTSCPLNQPPKARFPVDNYNWRTGKSCSCDSVPREPSHKPGPSRSHKKPTRPAAKPQPGSSTRASQKPKKPRNQPEPGTTQPGPSRTPCAKPHPGITEESLAAAQQPQASPEINLLPVTRRRSNSAGAVFGPVRPFHHAGSLSTSMEDGMGTAGASPRALSPCPTPNAHL